MAERHPPLAVVDRDDLDPHRHLSNRLAAGGCKKREVSTRDQQQKRDERHRWNDGEPRQRHTADFEREIQDERTDRPENEDVDDPREKSKPDRCGRGVRILVVGFDYRDWSRGTSRRRRRIEAEDRFLGRSTWRSRRRWSRTANRKHALGILGRTAFLEEWKIERTGNGTRRRRHNHI